MAINWRRLLMLTGGVAVATVLVLIGAGLMAQRYPSFLQYRVSVLGSPGAGDRLLALLSREWETVHRFVRLTPASGRIEENAGRLAAGEGDMAVVRGDDPAATQLRVIFRLQQRGLVILVPPRSAMETGVDLKGRKIAFLGGGSEDPLSTTVFAMLGIDAADVASMEPKDLGAAMRTGRVAAALAIVPLSVRSSLLIEAAQSITRSYRAKPSFLDLSEATAIAAAHPLYSASELTPSVFGAAVEDPSEAVNTLSVNILLVARPNLQNRIAGETASALTALRSRLLVSEPAIAQIAPPDLELADGIAAHPGVRAYLNGEQSSITAQAVDLYWTAGALMALLSPLLALLFGWLRGKPPDLFDRQLAKAVRLLKAAATARPEELARVETDLSLFTNELVQALADGELESEDFLALEAVLRHASAAAARRRNPSSAAASEAPFPGTLHP